MVSTLPAFYYSRKGLVCGFAPLFRHVLQGLFALCLCVSKVTHQSVWKLPRKVSFWCKLQEFWLIYGKLSGSTFIRTSNQTSFDIFKHCDNLIKKKTEADIIQRCAKVKALTTSVVVQDQKPLRRIVAWNTSAAWCTINVYPGPNVLHTLYVFCHGRRSQGGFPK